MRALPHVAGPDPHLGAELEHGADARRSGAAGQRGALQGEARGSREGPDPAVAEGAGPAAESVIPYIKGHQMQKR